jgi:hypothetical protein
MTSTTHAEFDDKTEGIEVAKAFAGVIRGKTILITGVNRAGVGFAIAEAFVCAISNHLTLRSLALSDNMTLGFPIACASHRGWPQSIQAPGEHRRTPSPIPYRGLLSSQT